jgi:hypothetical protein
MLVLVSPLLDICGQCYALISTIRHVIVELFSQLNKHLDRFTSFAREGWRRANQSSSIFADYGNYCFFLFSF